MKTVVIVLLSMILGGTVAYYTFSNKPDDPSPVVNVDEIRKVAKLATIEYHMTEVNFFKKPPVGMEWLPAEILVIMKGVISAGVNLKDAVIKVNEQKKIITLVIPKSAILILSVDIPPNGITYKTLSDPNPFHKLNDKDFEKAFKQSRAILVKAAESKDIKGKAKAEGKTILQGFIGALGYTADIQFDKN